MSAEGRSRQIARWLFENLLAVPLVAPLVRIRAVGFALLALATWQLFAVWSGGVGWPCPTRYVWAVPCPACGLSRAAAALASGEVLEAINTHAYVPLAVALFALLVTASLLPRRLADALAERVERIERRTGVSALAVYGAIAYWLARLAMGGEAFEALVGS